MTLSAKVNHCSCIMLQRLRPNRDKDEQEELLMDLCLECAQKTSIEMAFQSIQSQRCKDAPLRNSFFKLSFGVLTNQNKYLEEQFNHQSIEISVTQLKIYKPLEL